MSDVEIIWMICPKCSKNVRFTPNEWEPSIGHLNCLSCGCSSTIDLEEYQKQMDELTNSLEKVEPK